MIDSKQFYQYLQDTFAEVRKQLTEAGCEEVNIYVSSTRTWSSEGAPKFEIQIDSRGAGPKVEGRHLQECVNEYISRCGFATRQKLVALEAPKSQEYEEAMTEAKYPTPPPSNPMDDEIPF